MQHIVSLLAIIVAVNGSPVPQGITENIAPEGAMPAGCKANYNGMTFGIAIMTGTAMAGGAAATQAADGQPAVNQISDGQVQAMTQIADGQIQGPMPTCAASQIADGQVQGCMVPTPVSQINDGQVQAPTTAPVVSQISDGQAQAPTAPAVSQISDGQAQAPTAPAVSQISDGQAQAPTAPAVSQISDGQAQAPTAHPVSQISDGQVQQPPATAVGTMPDSQPTAAVGSGMSSGMTACMTDSTLELTLNNGVLLDNQGRTGYIAANYQFQFDAPAQTGAIYTAGWSICEGGVLALGSDKTFYRCRSGDFYNLYNENWAPQCEAVTIMAVDLVQC